MPSADGGLGNSLVGDKIMINHRHVQVTKLLGEGGFSYVYLVKEIADVSQGQSLNNTTHGDSAQRSGSGSNRSGSFGNGSNRSARPGSVGRGGPEVAEKREFVLKVTSILSRQQRDIAEKEAKLLSRLSHPSIIKMFDTCYRSVSHSGSSGFRKGEDAGKAKERPQHLILMEFCEGGHALDICSEMAAKGERFDLSTLIIAFGQICNAVSYLHAQRPPIVHRDLKPANFLVKNGAYKLCDFGSAVFGHVDLKTPEARRDAEEVIQKTTTQMFRAPEMVDLYMAKKLTQATDVWALGACLYSLAFLQNCFEEGSNLAILSVKYKIPDDNPYGEGLVELIDRMLTVDCKARADMTEVILCLSAVYSGRPLPPRKERASKSKKEGKEEASMKSGKSSKKKKSGERVGTFRTDGQGIYQDGLALDPYDAKKPVQAKKLDPNSAAARRRQAAAGEAPPPVENEEIEEFASFHNRFEDSAPAAGPGDQELAFSTTSNPFAAVAEVDKATVAEADIFGSFDNEEGEEVVAAFDSNNFDAFASFSPDAEGGTHMNEGTAPSSDHDHGSDHNDEEDDVGGGGGGGETSGDGHSGRDARPRSKSETRRRTGRSSRSAGLSKKDEEDLADAVEEMGMDDNQDGSGDEKDAKSTRSRRSHTSRSGRSRREGESTRRPSGSERSSRRGTSSREGGEPREKRSHSGGREESKPRIRSNA